MPCLFAICHRSHSLLCSLFQNPKPTKIQVKIAQLILSPLFSQTCMPCMAGERGVGLRFQNMGAVQLKLVFKKNELSYYFVPL